MLMLILFTWDKYHSANIMPYGFWPLSYGPLPSSSMLDPDPSPFTIRTRIAIKYNFGYLRYCCLDYLYVLSKLKKSKMADMFYVSIWSCHSKLYPRTLSNFLNYIPTSTYNKSRIRIYYIIVKNWIRILIFRPGPLCQIYPYQTSSLI